MTKNKHMNNFEKFKILLAAQTLNKYLYGFPYAVLQIKKCPEYLE